MTTLTVDLDQAQARDAVGWVSVGLGSLAVLAPQTTAGAFGVKGIGDAGTLLVRMVGTRNALMGLRTLQASGDEQARALQAGLAVGAVDAVALLLAARKGVLSKKAAFAGLLVLGAIAGLGYVAGLED
jgi:hypothetical protein